MTPSSIAASQSPSHVSDAVQVERQRVADDAIRRIETGAARTHDRAPSGDGPRCRQPLENGDTLGAYHPQAITCGGCIAERLRVSSEPVR